MDWVTIKIAKQKGDRAAFACFCKGEQVNTSLCCFCSKSSPAAVHLMEDALKWGVEHIFSRQRYITEAAQATDTATADQSRPVSAASPLSQGDVKMEDAPSPGSPSQATQEAGTAVVQSTPSPRRTPASASPEPSMKSPFGAPEQQQQQPHHRSKTKNKGHGKTSSSVFQPVYTDSVIQRLLQWSETKSSQPEAGDYPIVNGHSQGMADGRPGDAAQSLGEVLGSGWGCVKLHEWSQGQLDDDAHADEGWFMLVQAGTPAA